MHLAYKVYVEFFKLHFNDICNLTRRIATANRSRVRIRVTKVEDIFVCLGTAEMAAY